MIRHVALEVKESDIEDFYIGILGGKIIQQFTLNKNVSEELFQISKQIEVYKLCVNDLQFELFVHDSIEQDSLQHLCLELKDAREVYTKAKEIGYWNRLRNSDKDSTYFIRDKNKNMFELKTKAKI